MKVTVVGTGYVGLVTGACLAETGNTVICLDIDQKKIDRLKEGIIPIYEKGLEPMVRSNYQAGRLIFTTEVEEAVDKSEIIIIAVGTPPNEDGSADLKHVLGVARSIGQYMKKPKLVVTKSTVPVGTGDKVRAEIAAALKSRGVEIPFQMASNPEFLKEGSAVADFMKPDRILIGCDSAEAEEKLRELYGSFVMNGHRFISMDIRSAELCKYASNAMLATKISFMNELSRIAESVGADVLQVRQGMGADRRIGYEFTHAGLGYGGSCFPKDVNALLKIAEENGLEGQLLRAVEDVNDSQRARFISRILKELGSGSKRRRVAIWGLAFKPETDDIRKAPALDVISALLLAGHEVVAYDPIAADHVRAYFGLEVGSGSASARKAGVPPPPSSFDSRPEASALEAAQTHLHFSEDMYDVLRDCDAVVLCTEWKFFRSPDFERMKSVMRSPVVFDGRNQYESETLREKGFTYISVGRAPVLGTS